MSTTNTNTNTQTHTPPEFARAVSGYNREQVDEYVSTMGRLLDEARRRARTPSAGPRQEPDFALLGSRITSMLQLAEEEAEDRRRQGEQDAAAEVQRAREDADEMRRLGAEELERYQAAVEDAKREAETILETARHEAEDLLQRTRQHAEEQAEAIVGRAETEAERITDEAERVATIARDEQEARRQEHEVAVAALEERHRSIVADLARLRAALDSGGPTLEVDAPADKAERTT